MKERGCGCGSPTATVHWRPCLPRLACAHSQPACVPHLACFACLQLTGWPPTCQKWSTRQQSSGRARQGKRRPALLLVLPVLPVLPVLAVLPVLPVLPFMLAVCRTASPTCCTPLNRGPQSTASAIRFCWKPPAAASLLPAYTGAVPLLLGCKRGGAAHEGDCAPHSAREVRGYWLLWQEPSQLSLSLSLGLSLSFF